LDNFGDLCDHRHDHRADGLTGTPMRDHGVDKQLLILLLALIMGGLIIFYSASLGIFAKKGSEVFSNILISQIVFGLICGGVGCVAASYIPYRFWRSYALVLLIATMILAALVFIPGIGGSSGGAKRWIYLGPFSVQPSEFLKLGVVIYFAAFLSKLKGSARSSLQGTIAFGVLMAVTGALVLMEPDTGTFGIIAIATFAMLVVSGVPWKHVGMIVLIGVIGFGLFASVKPHVVSRLTTFIHPERDVQGAGYQLKQSLTAVGSGQISGRGFGKSLQKYYYLPEPVGDSIFAVAAEEFGFIGAMSILVAFLLFGARGLVIARRAPDQFSGLVVVGIVILIVTQAFINIASMIGVFPLTGVPLPFISHGGSALLAVLVGVGIVLNISRYMTKST